MTIMLERLARHLALQRDRDGSRWPAHVDAAAGILAVIKLPDDAMRDAGDAAAWTAMIDAALIGRAALGAAPVPPAPPPAGTDEEGDVPMPQSGDLADDPASWVQVSRD